MVFLNLIEKLISEHGSSSTILKKQIDLAKDEYTSLERRVRELQVEKEAVDAENKALKLDLRKAEQNIESLKEQLDKFADHLDSIHDSNPDGYVCDDCGSPDLTRTGNRLHQQLGIAGIKWKIFSCNACGKKSEFLPE